MTKWTKTVDEIGWERHECGAYRITVPPGGPTAQVPVRLFAPGCTTEHPSLDAAKRQAATAAAREGARLPRGTVRVKW